MNVQIALVPEWLFGLSRKYEWLGIWVLCLGPIRVAMWSEKYGSTRHGASPS